LKTSEVKECRLTEKLKSLLTGLNLRTDNRYDHVERLVNLGSLPKNEERIKKIGLNASMEIGQTWVRDRLELQEEIRKLEEEAAAKAATIAQLEREKVELGEVAAAKTAMDATVAGLEEEKTELVEQQEKSNLNQGPML
jgi:hypothetical protein